MKIPSHEFWFKLGLCSGHIMRLKEVHDSDNYDEEKLEEEKCLINHLYENLMSICETVYEEEEKDAPYQDLSLKV